MSTRWLLLVGLAIAWTQGVQAQEYPAAYPRPGATQMLENERVIVWNIAWLQQEYPVHRHRYDHIGVYYTSGDRIITSQEGQKRPVHTEPWNLSFQPRGVTHVEQGASAEPLRAVFVQIQDEARVAASRPTSTPVFPIDRPEQRLDNERATAWDYATGSAGASSGRHRHTHDAVVISFDATLLPTVAYVERGTEHESDVPAGSTRAWVLEIK